MVHGLKHINLRQDGLTALQVAERRQNADVLAVLRAEHARQKKESSVRRSRSRIEQITPSFLRRSGLTSAVR